MPASTNMKIKVCGMKIPVNINRVLTHRPDYMGFIFYKKSPRYINWQTIEHLEVPNTSSTLRVGVFVNPDLMELEEIQRKLSLDLIQLHGSESPCLVENIKTKDFKVIKAFQIGDKFNWKNLDPYLGIVDYFLFDTRSDNYGGSGTKFDWNILKDYPQQLPFFLSGGISLKDTDKIKNMDIPYLHGVDINSQFELEAGLKDPELIAQFIKSVKYA